MRSYPLALAVLLTGCGAVLGIDFDSYREREDGGPAPQQGSLPDGTTAGGSGATGGNASGGNTPGDSTGNTGGATGGNTGDGEPDAGRDGGTSDPDAGRDGGADAGRDAAPPGPRLLPCEAVGRALDCRTVCQSKGLRCEAACRVPPDTGRYAGLAASTPDCRTTSSRDYYPVGTCNDAFTSATVAIQCCCAP